MPVSFTAIDFETANSSPASACSVGLVKVVDGRVVEREHRYIRPPFPHDDFAYWNVRIHGITRDMVADAGGWEVHLPFLREFAGDDWLVAHNAGFDMGVIVKTTEVHGLPVPDFRYLCSLQVARRTYHLESYRLPSAAMAAGFEDFSHHDALADAEACAAIVVHAAKRHEADDLARLAHVTRVRVGAIGTVASAAAAAADGPMALQ
ncbi:DNA polymerase-3 subunit epsilon [Agromyces flavus]|uniref:DNA polymerase-3 subunit epsilon n=1 Tax=Agromyces flavus TaxID=589382 RepID=A0A1H1N7U6_9MICO|nr:3'-5' exonuclease [Agromyces flavus]MCP2369139.1 DNA polymerase-3 subunit epsilon [Agromyces flavus]GGI48619.1 DNA polymerase III subunit epsilon [Agromyces flavus]SDR95076.1 DNA polymerase-3 subunit epsilon [Agromyces flavus]